MLWYNVVSYTELTVNVLCSFFGIGFFKAQISRVALGYCHVVTVFDKLSAYFVSHLLAAHRVALLIGPWVFVYIYFFACATTFFKGSILEAPALSIS